ncbi:hypothetical protein F6455_01160 [Proteobacteria bacterium 005FR1]|nr:hypothetical protein [Proteobacteria bacterium 005FR1]
MKTMQAISLAMVTVLAPALGQAEQEAMPVGSVNHLLDNAGKYVNERITVPGEVEELLDPRTFVLESGGIFMDEVTVVVPKGTKGFNPALLREDSDIRVTGTVRQASAVDIEQELDFKFAPAIKIELDSADTYLVAETIEAR